MSDSEPTGFSTRGERFKAKRAIDVRCPDCDYSPVEHARYGKQTDSPLTREEVLDFFEVGGTDEDCVFCPECSCEFNPDTGEMPDEVPSDGQMDLF